MWLWFKMASEGYLSLWESHREASGNKSEEKVTRLVRQKMNMRVQDWRWPLQGATYRTQADRVHWSWSLLIDQKASDLPEKCLAFTSNCVYASPFKILHHGCALMILTSSEPQESSLSPINSILSQPSLSGYNDYYLALNCPSPFSPIPLWNFINKQLKRTCYFVASFPTLLWYRFFRTSMCSGDLCVLDSITTHVTISTFLSLNLSFL